MKTVTAAKYFLLFGTVISFISVSSVSALWLFPKMIEKSTSTVNVTLSPFKYKPSEVLPDDSSNGENHMELIEAFLNGKDGLNRNSFDKCIITRNFEKFNGLLDCRQQRAIEGGNLISAFLTAESRGLYFVLQFLSESEIAAFTFSAGAVTNGTAGSTLTVYRTVMEIEAGGNWAATGSVEGYVTLKMLVIDGNMLLGFDPRDGDWHAGKVPVN